MKVHTLLAEGLSVIGGVDQHRINGSICLAQRRNDACQHVVGIGDRVVVDVAYFLLAAVLQLARATRGPEGLALRRIALHIGWAVATDLMKHDERVLAHVRQARRQIGQHDLVVAIRVRAQRRVGVPCVRHGVNASADALTSGIVVAPFDVETALRERVQEIRIATRLPYRELFTPEWESMQGRDSAVEVLQDETRWKYTKLSTFDSSGFVARE